MVGADGEDLGLLGANFRNCSMSFTKAFHNDRYGTITIKGDHTQAFIHYRQLLDALKYPLCADLGDQFVSESILSDLATDLNVGDREALVWVRECVLRFSSECLEMHRWQRSGSKAVATP